MLYHFTFFTFVPTSVYSVVSLFFLNLFIFWVRWVFIAVCGLSLVVARGPTLQCSARASHCGGFSCCGARALGAQASVVVVFVSSVVVAPGLSCSMACGIFPDQGWNRCPLHWQADS